MQARRQASRWHIDVAVLVVASGGFCCGVHLLLDSSQDLAGTSRVPWQAFADPFVGICLGVFVTVLLQSSSISTSAIVALVGSGALSVAAAIPLVMGANLGTTVSGAMAAMGHATQREELRRAFAGATTHGCFNILAVCVLIPLELATSFLLQSSHAVAAGWYSVAGNLPNPVKSFVAGCTAALQFAAESTSGMTSWALACALIVVSLVLLIASFIWLTRTLCRLFAHRAEALLNRAVEGTTPAGVSAGASITAVVQSSRYTIALVVPLLAAGVLRVPNALPIVMGANLGTTSTPLLASLVAGRAGLQIAVVHLLINSVGTALLLGLPPARRVMIRCAEVSAEFAVEHRLRVVAYLMIVFVGLPLAGIAMVQLFT